MVDRISESSDSYFLLPYVSSPTIVPSAMPCRTRREEGRNGSEYKTTHSSSLVPTFTQLTMLAIHADADPPPGAEVLAPSCSTNERTVELTRGPSALLLMRYLKGRVHVNLYTCINIATVAVAFAMTAILSLVPRPYLSVFQCCTLKNESCNVGKDRGAWGRG